jgi:hypothetical protein
VASLEGPNEYNCRDDSPSWTTTLRRFQARLDSGVERDPRLSGVPVLAPTLCGAEAHDELRSLSGAVDFGNIHTYPGGAIPDDSEHTRFHLDLARKVSGGKPVQVTETGYHNALRVPASFGHRPVSERVAAVYLLRLYLEYFRVGFVRTYSYELLDQWPNPGLDNSEANFGLLRNDYSEKPAFKALRRLIALLNDPGPRFQPHELHYTIRGAPPSLRQLLLEKRDGSYYLALWNAVSIWNPTTLTPLHPDTETVQLSLDQPARQTELYRPSDDDRPLQRQTNTQTLSLPLTPSITIIKIEPSTLARDRRNRPLCRRRFCLLRRDEQRVVKALTRARGAQASARARASRKLRIRRLQHWLRRRAARIRHNARRTGWHLGHRRVRYRILRLARRGKYRA